MNKRGRLVSERLAWAKAVMGAEQHFPEWVEEGRSIVAELREVAHGEIPPSFVDESHVRDWQRYGWGLEAAAKAHGAAVVNEWLPSNRAAAERVAADAGR
jgi:hypothetical protein